MSEYVVGPTYARRDTPRFEFKAGSPDHTGGGYPRLRSTERRPHTPGDGADDVFVPVHRLAAVAWHLPDGTLGEDVHLSALSGADIHHTQPDRDRRGMPAANGEAWTEMLDHGDHSEVTQAEMRAWAADAREAVESDTDATQGTAEDSSRVCAACGAESDTLCIYRGVTEAVCPECAAAADPDGPIEVV